MKDCPFHKKMMAENGKNTFSSKSCCSNKTVYLQSDLDKNAQSVDYLVSSQLQQFVVAYVTMFLTTKIVKSIPVYFAEYSPPHISRDIYVLIQSFLI